MRLRMILVGCVAAVLTAIVFVGPSLAGSNGDSAVGGFQGVGGVNKVAFSAQSDANGANPSGYLSQTIPANQTLPQRLDRFDVTCLVVVGNHAWIGLTPSDATTAAKFPNGRTLAVIDNGPPVGGQPVDFYGYAANDKDCTQHTTVEVSNHPAYGDISVNDAP
jgi:hypothetical protein